MAVSDEIVAMTVGMMFIYLVLYRKNKLLGNIGYMGISIAMLVFSKNDIFSMIGIVMLLGSLANTIYDIVNKVSK